MLSDAAKRFEVYDLQSVERCGLYPDGICRHEDPAGDSEIHWMCTPCHDMVRRKRKAQTGVQSNHLPVLQVPSERNTHRKKWVGHASTEAGKALQVPLEDGSATRAKPPEPPKGDDRTTESVEPSKRRSNRSIVSRKEHDPKDTGDGVSILGGTLRVTKKDGAAIREHKS